MKKSIDLLKLRPTQFAVGMLEIDEKVKQVKKLGKKGLKTFVKETVIPVIVSPQKEYYLTDGHHFVCVCYHLGVKKVRIDVINDLSKSKMSYGQFWKWMNKQRTVYPFCQFGEGPREPLYLPKDIRGLADDPYRSLAWFVRKSGAFQNTDKNFAEFEWANFFRSKKLLSNTGHWGFARALVKAVKLSQSSKAKHLPGFDQLSAREIKKTRKKLKKHVSKHIN